MGSGLTYAESLLAAHVVVLVVTGAGLVVVATGGVLRGVRSLRAVGAFARAQLWPRVLRGWGAHRFRKLPLLSDTSQLTPAARVRLTGVVESESLARAELSGIAAVVARHEVGERGGGAVGRGTAARNFSLRLADGSRVRVLAEQAAQQRGLRLYDRQPHRWRGDRGDIGWACESRVEPGQTIEVIGQLLREVDATAARASDRQPALGWTVVAAEQPLFLRFATPAQKQLTAAPSEVSIEPR